MGCYGEKMNNLIAELSRLPGIGNKSAQRLAFYILDMPKGNVESLTNAINDAKESIRYCSVCGNITDNDPCSVCRNTTRNHKQIMVVEEPKDMAAYEKTNEYKGTYHILHGCISPMLGIGPDNIKIRELISRLNDGKIDEVIIATNPTIEGEATAMYISKLIKPLGIKVTRIAHGIPIGGSLEYVDEVTLMKAFEGRREI